MMDVRGARAAVVLVLTCIFSVGQFLRADPVCLKPAETPVVWFLDIEKLSKDEIIAATAIQGLANRNGPRVFLRQTDRFKSFSYSFYKNYRERISADTLAKYPSPDLFWMDYYSRKWGYRFQEAASLDELLQRQAQWIKGAVRIGRAEPNAEALAATIAGLQDLVPVSDEGAKRCPGLAKLPVVVDLRERFFANAAFAVTARNLEWAIAELLPKTSSTTLFSYPL